MNDDRPARDNRTEIHTLSGAYALNAVDPAERIAFERHLDGCADCRTEVATLREAAGRLAATTQRAPAPPVRQAVLGEIRTVRPLPPATRLGRTAAGAARGRRRGPALAAAAAIVLAVLAGVGAAITTPWRAEPGQARTAAERVLQAADTIRMRAQLPRGGEVTLVRSASVGRGFIVTDDLAPAPPGTVYQLWLQNRQGTLVPAGLLSNRPDQMVLLQDAAEAAQAVGVTVEPDGGSQRPTSAPIALFDLTGNR